MSIQAQIGNTSLSIDIDPLYYRQLRDNVNFKVSAWKPTKGIALGAEHLY